MIQISPQFPKVEKYKFSTSIRNRAQNLGKNNYEVVAVGCQVANMRNMGNQASIEVPNVKHTVL